MADVFISYKKEDFAIAERVVNALKASGLSVWWDDGLDARSAWDEELEREIAAAGAVVVLWTPRSINSEWVRTEAHYGQERGKLIPAMVEECEIPIAFMLRQTISLRDWKGDGTHRQWKKLLAWVADLAASKPGNAAVGQKPGGAPSNTFHEVVGRMASGEPVVDGALVNVSTPAGTAFRDGDGLPVMRIVPDGAFTIGSPATDRDRAATEGPQKRVEIPQPFAIGIFPVLICEFETAIGFRPEQPEGNPAAAQPRGLMSFFRRQEAKPPATAQANRAVPVTSVSFDDAQAFVTCISQATGESYRLPSESEWEYACRSGSRTRYSFGDTIDASMALFAATAGPALPGSFAANAFGLWDMHGNVREWTSDLWHESYDSTPLDGSPATEGHSSMRVVRGGGWSDPAAMLRSAARMRATQSIRAQTIGFRVIRTLS